MKSYALTLIRVDLLTEVKENSPWQVHVERYVNENDDEGDTSEFNDNNWYYDEDQAMVEAHLIAKMLIENGQTLSLTIIKSGSEVFHHSGNMISQEDFENKTSLMVEFIAKFALEFRGIDTFTENANWFMKHADVRVRNLYCSNPNWKKKINKGNGDYGRDYVTMFVNHWADAFVFDPQKYIEQHPYYVPQKAIKRIFDPSIKQEFVRRNITKY